MFKKPFKVKSNTAIRGSERRKFRDAVGKNFPDVPRDMLSTLVPNKEEVTVMKILTHNETNVICYCLKKNPIFFDVNGCILPTVYTLWEHGNICLSFKTFPHVLGKLQGGADLMFPGIIPPATGFTDFESNRAAAVTLLGNGAAVAVGMTTCSKQQIDDYGAQGKKVAIYHCAKDYLWASGDKSDIPRMEEKIEQPFSLSQQEGEDEDKEDAEVENKDGKSLACIQNEGGTEGAATKLEHSGDNEDEIETEPVAELSPQEEMDLLLRNCFYQAVINAKKAELPMLVTKFVSQFLHPVCPDGKRIDVKKSSFKKMSKFLNEMVTCGLINMKEFSKGVESITFIAQENELLREYKRTDFAKVAKEVKEMKLTEQKEEDEKNKQGVQIREMYSVSGKTVPFFGQLGLSKGTVLSTQDIRKVLMQYVKEQELINPINKKEVKPDALLTDTLFKKGEHQHVVSWDLMMNNMIGNMNPCCEIKLPGEKPIIKKGKMEQIEVTTEKRMGNKKVTLIKNLENYGIDLKEFAQELQQLAASSTALHQIPGGKGDRYAVQAQGTQLKHVKTLLDKQNVPKKYIKGLDSIEAKSKRR